MDVSPFSLLLNQARDIVFLSGAGMSTESGIPDFRSAQGLYSSGVSEEVFDIDVFKKQPEVFYNFARAYGPAFRKAVPHAGHRAITRLSKRPMTRVAVITQNIDNLHQQAGNPMVLPVHGLLSNSLCQSCGAMTPTDALWPEVEAGRVPRHSCGGVFKPDIVFYGEPLSEVIFRAARNRVFAADLLVICGTSLTVYPAGGLPRERTNSCKVVVVNQTETWLDAEADLVFRDSIGSVLEQAVG